MNLTSRQGVFEHCERGSCVAPFYCHCVCLSCREIRIATQTAKDMQTLRRMIAEKNKISVNEYQDLAGQPTECLAAVKRGQTILKGDEG